MLNYSAVFVIRTQNLNISRHHVRTRRASSKGNFVGEHIWPHTICGGTILTGYQYRGLLRTGAKFSSYGYREYALRRTKDAFREHRTETDASRIRTMIEKGFEELKMMKVNQMHIGLQP